MSESFVKSSDIILLCGSENSWSGYEEKGVSYNIGKILIGSFGHKLTPKFTLILVYLEWQPLLGSRPRHPVEDAHIVQSSELAVPKQVRHYRPILRAHPIPRFCVDFRFPGCLVPRPLSKGKDTRKQHVV